jgi:hypothetical protein
VLARSERFELPTLGFEVRCSIQLSYERSNVFNELQRPSQSQVAEFPKNIEPKRSPARPDYQSWAGRATGAFSGSANAFPCHGRALCPGHPRLGRTQDVDARDKSPGMTNPVCGARPNGAFVFAGFQNPPNGDGNESNSFSRSRFGTGPGPFLSPRYIVVSEVSLNDGQRGRPAALGLPL